MPTNVFSYSSITQMFLWASCPNLGSPESRGRDKNFNVGGLFGRRSQRRSMKEQGEGDRKGRTAAIYGITEVACWQGGILPRPLSNIKLREWCADPSSLEVQAIITGKLPTAQAGSQLSQLLVLEKA